MFWQQVIPLICNCIRACREQPFNGNFGYGYWQILSRCFTQFWVPLLTYCSPPCEQAVIFRQERWSKAVSNLYRCDRFSRGCFLSGCHSCKHSPHGWLASGSYTGLCNSFVCKSKVSGASFQLLFATGYAQFFKQTSLKPGSRDVAIMHTVVIL